MNIGFMPVPVNGAPGLEPRSSAAERTGCLRSSRPGARALARFQDRLLPQLHHLQPAGVIHLDHAGRHPGRRSVEHGCPSDVAGDRLSTLGKEARTGFPQPAPLPEVLPQQTPRHSSPDRSPPFTVSTSVSGRPKRLPALIRQKGEKGLLVGGEPGKKGPLRCRIELEQHIVQEQHRFASSALGKEPRLGHRSASAQSLNCPVDANGTYSLPERTNEMRRDGDRGCSPSMRSRALLAPSVAITSSAPEAPPRTAGSGYWTV